MTILRAVRELDMDVDLEHQTDIPNIDTCNEGITLYGVETKSGELYYVVLDRETVEVIQKLQLPDGDVDGCYPEIPVD